MRKRAPGQNAHEINKEIKGQGEKMVKSMQGVHIDQKQN